MGSVIGLILREAAVDTAVERLKEAGIYEERISILSNPNTLNKLLGCDPACVIKNYTVWGTAIGIGIYAILGMAAAICQYNLMQYGQAL